MALKGYRSENQLVAFLTRSIVLSMKCLSLIRISIALFGHCSTQRPHMTHASSITAVPSFIWMQSMKQTSWVHAPQPVQFSLTCISKPGILCIVAARRSSSRGRILHRQQQGQQLQTVTNGIFDPTPSQVSSSISRPMRCTNPCFRQRSTCSKASFFETALPSSEGIFRAASPMKRHPRSIG
jgi:hypothetical protein